MRRQDWSPKLRTGFVVVSRARVRGSRSARYLVRRDASGRAAVWTTHLFKAKYFASEEAAREAARLPASCASVVWIREGEKRGWGRSSAGRPA